MNNPKPASRVDRSGPFSMYDMCPNVAELLSDEEYDQYSNLLKQQKDELREYAHDVTVNAIFKMMYGC